MTIEEARKEIIDIDTFCYLCCNNCIGNDWYCPSFCKMLIKARELDFDRIVKCYARHDGDLKKVYRYIKQTKLKELQERKNDKILFI